MEKLGVKLESKSDLQIYPWTYRQCGPRCNKRDITFIGKVGGVHLQPAVADFNIYLVAKVYSEMKPFGPVLRSCRDKHCRNLT